MMMHGSFSDGRQQDKAEQIRQSAQLGHKRFQVEAELQAKLKREKQEEERRRKGALARAEQAKGESSERRKEWFRDEKQRKEERELYEKRKAEERRRFEQAKEQKEEKRKQQQAYMKGLHDSAAEKFRVEKLRQMERDQRVKMRTDAEREYRLKIERLARRESTERENIEAETRARLAVIEDHAKKLLYPLLQWQQMKLHEHEQWLRSERSKSAASATDLDRIARERKQKMEKEYAHRKQEIDAQVAVERAAAGRQRQAALNKLEQSIREEKATNDRMLSQKLEDAAQYKLNG